MASEIEHCFVHVVITNKRQIVISIIMTTYFYYTLNEVTAQTETKIVIKTFWLYTIIPQSDIIANLYWNTESNR